jgi:hypothetical protein
MKEQCWSARKRHEIKVSIPASSRRRPCLSVDQAKALDQPGNIDATSCAGVLSGRQFDHHALQR